MGICLGRSPRNDHSISGQVFGHLFGAKVVPGSAKSSANSSCTQVLQGNSFSAPVGSTVEPSFNIRSFTYDDLKCVTRNFSADNLIGKGGFGYVFKGWINEHTWAPCRPGTGMVVAVKKLKLQSFQGHREWLTEVNYLSQLHHQNLVKLIGYCSESKNRLLVYEFLPKGSLDNHLFKKGGQPMTWPVRMQIALDIARGLAFLHSLDANLIYRDLKASNILLDSTFHAKLSDFGLARKGPIGDGTHVSTRVVGTVGYTAPEYIASGRLTSKSDVYSFGVVLLELLSGRRAVGDDSIGGSSSSLVEWSKPFITGERRQFSRIMDTRLKGEYYRTAAQGACSLAVRCVDNDSKQRPPMQEVLSELEQLHALRTHPELRWKIVSRH